MKFTESLTIACPVGKCPAEIEMIKHIEYQTTQQSGEYQGKCTKHRKVIFVKLEYMVL